MNLEEVFDGVELDDPTTSVLQGSIPGCGSYQVLDEPTSNCQLYIIGGVSAILDADKETRLETFRKIQRKIDKPMLLIDIQEEYEGKVDDLFAERNILMKQRYKSTNDSEMILYLVRTRGMRRWGLPPKKKKQE